MICVSYLPGVQNCTITLPLSKSILNRLLVINFLSGGCIIPGLEAEADDVTTMQKLLGEISEGRLNPEVECELDAGNAGTVMRFISALLAITPGEWLLTGSARMLQRPMKPLSDALLQLGAELSFPSCEGYPPLRIYGKQGMQGGVINVDGGISSQFISALMMIGPALEGGIEIKLKGTVTSRPYIAMTKALMRKSGAEVHFNENSILVATGKYTEFKFPELAEYDWSAAAFWFELVALAQGTSVLLRGLTKKSVQGDAVLPDIFRKLGVRSSFTDRGLEIEKSGKPVVTEFNYDFTDCPDLAQAVIVTCAALGIKGCFTGLKTLRIKETDRIEALRSELTKLGYQLDVTGEAIVLPVSKPTTLNTEQPVLVNCYDDHRMAMSFAPLALLHDKICLDQPDAVNKSYPGYWTDIAQFGLVSE